MHSQATPGEDTAHIFTLRNELLPLVFQLVFRTYFRYELIYEGVGVSLVLIRVF
jgi:hypothetical protein